MWEAGRLWEEISVGQVMSREVVSVRPDTLVTHAVQLMRAYHFNSLPVVDQCNFPIGIVTEVDIFRLFLDAAKVEPRPERVPAELVTKEVVTKERVPTEPLPENIDNRK
jgi:CBS domain-containing protein